MSEPTWDAGLDWSCNLCGSVFNSQWAADACADECRAADRDARRR